MGALGDFFGGLLKPLLVALLVLIALGLFSNRQGDAFGSGAAGAGFECRSYTTDPEWNRIICLYHPARILQMPVTDLVPAFFKGDGAETEGVGQP